MTAGLSHLQCVNRHGDIRTMQQMPENVDRLAHWWPRALGEPLQPGDRALCGLLAPDVTRDGSIRDGTEPRIAFGPGDMPCIDCALATGNEV